MLRYIKPPWWKRIFSSDRLVIREPAVDDKPDLKNIDVEAVFLAIKDRFENKPKVSWLKHHRSMLTADELAIIIEDQVNPHKYMYFNAEVIELLIELRLIERNKINNRYFQLVD